MFAGAGVKATRRMALRAALRKFGIFFACNFGKTARRRFSPGTDGRHLIFRELLRCAVWEKTKGEGMMKPLEGIKVVELTTYFAAPACGRMLADWGAEVKYTEYKSKSNNSPYTNMPLWGEVRATVMGNRIVME